MQLQARAQVASLSPDGQAADERYSKHAAAAVCHQTYRFAASSDGRALDCGTGSTHSGRWDRRSRPSLPATHASSALMRSSASRTREPSCKGQA